MLTALMAALALHGSGPAPQQVIGLSLMEACGDVAVAACRLPNAISADAAAERLRDGQQSWWIEDGVFNAVARRDAPVVILCCALQSAMERVQGSSDLWALSVRVEQIDKAILDIFIMPSNGPDQPQVWRGPEAPAPAPRGDIAEDAVIRLKVMASTLGEERELFFYRPPGTGPWPVVYFADGDIRNAAQLIEARVAAGDVPPMMLVGLGSGPADTAGMTDEDRYNRRHNEYLQGWDDTIYEAHERFLIEDVMPLAESMGASTLARERAVAGTSDGAGWAIGMATRHPDLFGGAIALSFGNYGPWLEDRAASGRFGNLYLAAGVFEPGFHTDTTKAADLLRSRSARVRFESGIAGHSPAFWDDQIPQAAVWLFSPDMP